MNNYGKLSLQEIANTLRKTYNSISHKAHKQHLDSRKLWSEDENSIIMSNYSSNPDVWSLLPGRSRTAITKQARKLGVKRECGNYKINHRFFEKWTHDSAYIIGFMIADGCVEPKLNRISIALSTKDYDHLKKIRDVMDSRNPICVKKMRNECALYIHNRKMVNDIINKGVIPHKTHRTKLPLIPSEYMPDLIRGIFDGDGSIYRHGNEKRIQFLGSKQMVEDIKEFFWNKGLGGHTIRQHNKGSDGCWDLIYSSKNDVYNIINFMYYDGCLSMVRKMVPARGATPGIIKSAQIGQVNSSTVKEPEGKTYFDTNSL